MLNWNVSDIRKYKDKPFSFKEEIDLETELKSRSKDILNVGKVNVDGQLFNDNGLVISDIKVATNVTLPSTRSLEEVSVPLKFRINEAYNIDNIDTEEFEEDTIIIPIDEEDPVIDVYESVLDNILLNIPTQVLTEKERSENIMPSGNNWTVISEEEYNKQKEEDKQVNPEFAKLKNLFKDNNEEE
ncbi:YceD family protein [Companilactobacillus kedongensis]|uniref:YceD family protein n=1 Tax=Companilactobacillus kedongensis TaxID=2486004 RepID=UPI000F7A754E|nr:YceD family protein [Companilactobacillus kedongensis]